MNYELKKYSGGEMIGKAFNIYLAHFPKLALISLILTVPSFLLSWSSSSRMAGATDMTMLSSTMMSSGLTSIISLFTSAILSAILTLFVAQKILGQKQEDESLLKQALPVLLPIVALSLIVAVIIVAGMVALIVPGIILAVGLSIAPIILVVERIKVGESIKRSWSLTKGNKGQIFGLMLLLGLIIIAIYFAVLGIMSLITGNGFMELMQAMSAMNGDISQSLLISSIVSQVVSALLTPLSSALLVVIYFNLRVEKEGFDVEHLTNQFGNESQSE